MAIVKTAEAEKTMKRCQIGTRNYNEANDLHAECYGTIGALVQERDKLRHLLNRLLEEVGEHDRSDGNAPGHCHQVPGVWDSDNGKKAGKPCAWCALWAEAKATILTPNLYSPDRASSEGVEDVPQNEAK